MKKTKWTLILTMIVLVSLSLSAQKLEDMVGTWEGMGTLEGEPEPNSLTLVLLIEEGKLVGHMSDQFGSMYQETIDKINLEENTFTFSVSVDMGGPVSVNFVMKVEGDSMDGKFEIPDAGMHGAWEATKQK